MYTKLAGLVLISLALSFQGVSPGQSEGCSEWILPISAVDEHGKLIRGLTIHDLQWKGNSSQEMDATLEPETRIHRVVILLDGSSSMSSEAVATGWKYDLELIQHFIRTTATQTQFAFVLFSDHVLEKVDFSQEGTAISQSLQRIAIDPRLKKNAHGKTALYDALAQGFQLLERPTSADALFVITDGGDNASKLKPAQLQVQFAAQSVRVFGVLISNRPSDNSKLSPQEVDEIYDFTEFTARSGGAMFGPLVLYRSGQVGFPGTDHESLSERLHEFYGAMLENNVLTFHSKPGESRSKSIEITLREPARSRWKGAQLWYPRHPSECQPTATKSAGAEGRPAQN